MIDTKKRSILKAVTWRLFAIVLLMAVTYFVTRDMKSVTYVTLAYHLIQVGMFFLHERMWQKIYWGKSSGVFIQMTGMSGSGKTTLASSVAKRLLDKGYQVEVIDGDEYRTGLCSDLGFSRKDRNTNIRRLGFVSKVLARNNIISIIAAINPYEDIRKEISIMSDRVRTVYVACDLNILKDRDTKGLYRRAVLPDNHPDKVYNFTGVSDPYEIPINPDLVIKSGNETVDQSIKKLENFIIRSVS